MLKTRGPATFATAARAREVRSNCMQMNSCRFGWRHAPGHRPAAGRAMSGACSRWLEW
jgi:hypothetical protein